MRIILLVAAALASSGCFWPHCRNPKDGRFISCKAPGAVIVTSKVPLGTIDQKTGLVFTKNGWERFWWQDAFESAKAKGCILHDSCGVFPPYYIGAEYCGDPIEVCPGSSWQIEHDKKKAAR